MYIRNNFSLFQLKSVYVRGHQKSFPWVKNLVELPYPGQKLPQPYTIFCPVFFKHQSHVNLRLYKLGCKWLKALLTVKETRLRDPNLKAKQKIVLNSLTFISSEFSSVNPDFSVRCEEDGDDNDDVGGAVKENSYLIKKRLHYDPIFKILSKNFKALQN